MQHTGRVAASSLPIFVKVGAGIALLAFVASVCLSPGKGLPKPEQISWRGLALEVRSGTIPPQADPGTLPIVESIPTTTLPPPPTTTTSSTTSTTTTTTTAPPVAEPIVTASPPQQQSNPGDGCQAALAYLQSHAAPGFVAMCPHDAEGHQAETICDNAPRCQPGTMFIYIADPCPAAYMNEASNSYVLIGQSNAPWDPFGYCGEPGNPYG
jgi:hypothetical protein